MQQKSLVKSSPIKTRRLFIFKPSLNQKDATNRSTNTIEIEKTQKAHPSMNMN